MIPEFRVFKRINSDLIGGLRRIRVEGDRSAAARRNLIERDNLLKKLEKGQTLRLRGRRRVTTLLLDLSKP